MARRKRPVALIDEPSSYATLQTWQQHLNALEKLSPDALLKVQMIKTARETFEKKRTARTAA